MTPVTPGSRDEVGKKNEFSTGYITHRGLDLPLKMREEINRELQASKELIRLGLLDIKFGEETMTTTRQYVDQKILHVHHSRNVTISRLADNVQEKAKEVTQETSELTKRVREREASTSTASGAPPAP